MNKINHRLAVILFFTAFTFIFNPWVAQASNSDSALDEAQNAKEIVGRFFIEGYEKHNYDFVMECVSENYIDHSPAAARSNADAVTILKIVQSQFSDLKIRILDVFGEKGYVATRIRFEGTHTGTCMGIHATGKYVSFEALEYFRVCGNKIVESWGYWPDEAIRRQLTDD